MIFNLKLSPSPWHKDQGKIKDKDGNVLVKYPQTNENPINESNAELMAAAPNLLAAVVLSIQLLEGLQREQIKQENLNQVRKALIRVVSPFFRQRMEKDYSWRPEYLYNLLMLYGSSEDELHEFLPDDEEFAKYKAYTTLMDTKMNQKEKPKEQ